MKIQYDVYQVIQDRKGAIERMNTTREVMRDIGSAMRAEGCNSHEICRFLRERGYPINSNNVYPMNPNRFKGPCRPR